MISSDHEPFTPSDYSVEEEPLINYTLSPWTHPQGFDHSMTFPLQHDHHLEQPSCCIPFPHPLFPSHHNLVASTKHNILNSDCDKNFLRIIIHSTIVYLEGRPHVSSPRDSSYLTWKPYFPPHHPQCVWVCIRFGICYISNHTGRHMYIDMMICWLHWLYDYA